MLAGLKRVPVVIRDVTERQSLEMAIIENIQRDDLTCIEEGRSYKHLMSDFMMTQEQVALKVGKDRATVANMVRLLLLPPEIQNDLAEKKLTMGHARALLAVPSEKKQIELRDKIIKDSLSVRQVENIIHKMKKNKDVPIRRDPTDFTYLIEELKKSLQAKVAVKGKKNKGKIIIHYSSANELDRIFGKIVD
jgi:ParB family transcriptional regulator, chromosome partitioning protein